MESASLAERLAASEQSGADLSKALRTSQERADTLATKLETAEFSCSRLQKQITSQKAQAAKDEVGPVTQT